MVSTLRQAPTPIDGSNDVCEVWFYVVLILKQRGVLKQSFLSTEYKTQNCIQSFSVSQVI